LLWIVALFSGIGFPAYIVCWLVIPKAKVWPPPGYGGASASPSHPHQTALLSGFVILGLVAVIGTGVEGLGQYLLPAALVGVGVYLLSQRAALSEAAAAAPAGADPAAAASSLDLTPWRAGDASRSGRTGLVTPTVLSLLAIGAGVLAALHAAGVAQVSIASVAAGALVLVGGGLLASLWLGRARGLVPLGLGLVCVMLVAPTFESWADDSWSDGDSDGHIGAILPDVESEGTGEVTFAPQTLANLQSRYDHGVGKFTLDLSALDFSQETREVSVNLGVGKALVIVRPDTPLEVSGDVGIGKAKLLGSSKDGLGTRLSADSASPGPGKLVLRLHVGIGKAEVRHGS
jgi:hypothetical protein